MDATARTSPFLWGAATAAFQVEGALARAGRGPSIWDQFPGATSGAAVACDHYQRTAEDIELMRRLGLRAYRFSLSWPRLMPRGRGALNESGFEFYDRLIDSLCAAGIEPFATLYHWDLPAALQAELGGWAHADLPHIFADYAETAFRRFGDRVHYWLTLNEPWVVVNAGYFEGCHPPAIRDRALGYRVGHNLLRGHAYAAARFRALGRREGAISLALNANFSFPATSSTADAAAAERALLNLAGWFGDPVFSGEYPAVLRERLGALLPLFSAEEETLLKRSTDFIALNYYMSDVVRHAPESVPMEIEKVPVDGPRTAMDWPIVPDGLRRLLLWLHDRYGDRPVFITENGAAFDDQPDAQGFVNDQDRIAYLQEHIAAASAARAAGVDLRGYFVWSLLDNLEWTYGLSKRFGLIRCDFETQKRIIKASGHWYAAMIAGAQCENAGPHRPAAEPGAER